MPGFLDKLKSGADKAAFEADRLRRVSQAQSALNQLKRDVDAQILDLGRQVLTLYDAGILVQVELVAACQAIDAQRQKVSAQEAEIERIREERPAEAAVPEPAATQVPEPVRAPAPPPAPAPAAPRPAPAVAGRACPNCGAELREGIRFCPECGAKTVDEAPPVQAPAGAVCARCGTPLKPGLRFCPECGTPVTAP